MSLICLTYNIPFYLLNFLALFSMSTTSVLIFLFLIYICVFSSFFFVSMFSYFCFLYLIFFIFLYKYIYLPHLIHLNKLYSGVTVQQLLFLPVSHKINIYISVSTQEDIFNRISQYD